MRLTALKNFTDAGLVDTGEEFGNANEKVLREVPSEMTSIKVGGEELSAALKKQGIDIKPDDLTLFRAEKPMLGENRIMIKDGDKIRVFEGTPG